MALALCTRNLSSLLSCHTCVLSISLFSHRSRCLAGPVMDCIAYTAFVASSESLVFGPLVMAAAASCSFFASKLCISAI